MADFYSSPGRRPAYCRRCTGRDQVTRQSSPATRAAIRRWNAANRERLQLMQRAGYRVRLALRAGTLTRPDRCASCGATGVRICAAHHDYARPLEVTWLCASCHGAWDHAQPKTTGKGVGA